MLFTRLVRHGATGRFRSGRATVAAAATVAWALGAVSASHAQNPAAWFEDSSALLATFSHRSSGIGAADGLAGAAWLDYDGDGRLDLFLTGGGASENALFHNDGDGFTDLAGTAGVAGHSAASGVLAADLDNDGDSDLLLTGNALLLGGNSVVLYRNDGKGGFEDVTAQSGIVGPTTAASATAGDIDGDGLLDLFVGASGGNDRNRLFVNRGELVFGDVGTGSGVDTATGACGGFFADVNGDRLLDLVVSNCSDARLVPAPIELFINTGGFDFFEAGSVAGLGTGGYWMGLCPADFDDDGRLDLFATNVGPGRSPGTFRHGLFEGLGYGAFTEVGSAAGLGDLGFASGCAAIDADNDGARDLFLAGSMPHGAFAAIGPGAGNAGSLLRNLGAQPGSGHPRFVDETDSLPLDLSSRFSSGVAAGDYDDDGFEDLVVATDELDGDGGHPVLYHNLGGPSSWLAVELEGTRSNRDGVGAKIALRAAGSDQTMHALAGAGYLSSHAKRIGFGLGTATYADRLQVYWPSGLVERFDDVPANQVLHLVEGECGGDPAGCHICAPVPEPARDCRGGEAGRSTLRLRSGVTAHRDNFRWTLGRADAASLDAFDLPAATDAIYAVCVYDGSDEAQPRMESQIPVGGRCGGAFCWNPLGRKGYKYKNPSAQPHGITFARLKSGPRGKAAVSVQGRGARLRMPPSDLAFPITVQFLIDASDGTRQCWQTRFSSALKRDGGKVVAKGP